MAIVDDVQWDFQSAAEAAQALRYTSGQLDILARERALLVQALLDEWQGGRRVEFDDRLDFLLRRTLQLAAHCREQAHRILRADEQCRAEQQRRVRLRQGI